MFSQNKINFSSSNGPLPSQSLSALLQSLKQQRSLRLGHQGSSELHSEQHEEPSSPLKDNYSEAAKSLPLNPPLHPLIQEGPLSSKYHGDPALKNKGRMGHANRYTVKQYMIPPQFFTPTKQKLEAHLRFSRILSSENQTTPIANKSLQQPPRNQAQTFYQNLSREAEYSALAQSKVLKKQNIPRNQKLYQLNSDLALKYCMVNRLTPAADAKEILVFFVRLLEILTFTIPEPRIEKYKDCIFFGFETKNGAKAEEKHKESSPFGHHTEGLLYYFSGSLYMGQLYKNTMHGNGIQIFFRSSPERLANPAFPAIYKGEFRNGVMKGYFQVKKEGERYSGDVENGVYHGYGRLENQEGKTEGEFRNGKFVGEKIKEGRRDERNFGRRYGQNLSMIQMEHPSHSKQMEVKEDNRMRDAGTMIQRGSYPRSFSHQNQYNSRLQQPKSYRKVVNPKLQQLNQDAQEFEVDPWSYPSSPYQQKSSSYVNNSNEMLEFSYPFGHEIMVQQSTQAYKAPMMRTHKIKARGGQVYQSGQREKDNPERAHFGQMKKSRDGIGMLKRGERSGMFGGHPREFSKKVDSEEGQEQPLVPKC